MIRGWLSPYVGPTVSLSAEYYERTKAQAIGMLSDLLRLAKGDLGVSGWALQWNDDLQLGLDIPIDHGFATLFPVESRRQDWRVVEQAQRQAVEELAAAWCHEDASSVAERLVAYEKAAASYGRRWPRWNDRLCQLISHSTEAPLRWSQAMIDAHAPGDLIAPFLARAVELRHARWQDQVVRCIGSQEMVYSMLELVFTLPEPPPALLELALSRLSGWENGVQTWCIRGQVSEKVTRSLLAHPDRGVAEAAARGEWHAGPERGVRQSLRNDWRQVVAHCSCDFWLVEVFAKHDDLAYEWLVSNLCELPYFPSHRQQDVLRAAIRALDQGTRQMVLDQVPTSLQCLFVLKVLVQDDIALYERLLANDTLVSYHLVPLSGMPDDSWVSRSLVALGRYAPEEIARAAYKTVEIGFFSGDMSGRCHEWVQAFDRLASHHDERIREIGRIGRQLAQRWYESALASERRDAIYGW